MPRYKKAHGWKDEATGKFCTSLLPRESNGAVNIHETPSDALRAVSLRKMTIQWENPAEIDGHQHQ